MNKNRWSRASREALEELATAADTQKDGGQFTFSVRLCRALAALREVCPPLRTRAEVDAEIVRVLREDVESHEPWNDCLCEGVGCRIRKLCKEETQDP